MMNWFLKNVVLYREREREREREKRVGRAIVIGE